MPQRESSVRFWGKADMARPPLACSGGSARRGGLGPSTGRGLEICVPLAQLPCTAPGLGSSQTVAADVLGFAPARPERVWQWPVDAAGRPVREVEPLAVLGPVDAALYVLPL